MKKMFMAVIALMMTISASAQFYIYCSDGNVIKVDSISLVAQTEKVLFYKIVQLSEMGPVLQSANTYNPLTENNLINDLGFIKYTEYDPAVTIGGGNCLILTTLEKDEIAVLDALGLEASIEYVRMSGQNLIINGYNVYVMQIGGAATYKLKIK